MDKLDQLRLQVYEKAERLANRYDGENDIIPGAPDVTFTDFSLLDICLVLNEQMKLFKERMDLMNDTEIDINLRVNTGACEDTDFLSDAIQKKLNRISVQHAAEKKNAVEMPAVTNTDRLLSSICANLMSYIRTLEERIERLEKEAGHE